MKIISRILIVLSIAGLTFACDDFSPPAPSAESGVSKARAYVKAGSDGLTVEQRNVKRRLETDNIPGSIKHLYVISSYSGDVIIYSTVDGKVTSGGKRLTPVSVESTGEHRDGFDIRIGNWSGSTTEVLQDDGTYGNSMNYLFWFDANGVYHQHYVTGGQIVHIADAPLSVPKILINISPTKN